VADQREGGLRRAHQGRLAGGTPRRRGGPGAGRTGDVRGVGRARPAVGRAARPGGGSTRRAGTAAATVPPHRPARPGHLQRGGDVRGKLDLDPAVVRKARRLARRAGKPVVDLARSHTTLSVERAVLRLAGVSGADPDAIPWVNRLVDAVVADVGLGHGVAVPVFHALATSGAHDLTLLAQK